MSGDSLVPVVRRVGRRPKGSSKGGGRAIGSNTAGGSSAGSGVHNEGDRERGPRNEEPGVERGEEEIQYRTDFRNERDVCDGDYARKPLPGEPKLGICYFVEKHIRYHPHMKTLKAIMRANWPASRIDVKVGIVARRDFVNKRVKQFWEYYYYPPELTSEQGDALVAVHITSNIRQNMYGDKLQAKNKAKKTPGKTLRDFVPKHLEPLAWNALCDYWKSEEFQEKSVTNKGNRQHKKLGHTTGPTALGIFREDMEKKEGRPLDPLELFEMAHSKKNVPDGTDPLPAEAHQFKAELAKVIQEYKESEEAKSQPLESLSPEQRKQLEAKLILRAKGPYKNRIFMQPRCTATEILGSHYLNEWSEHRTTSGTQLNIDTGIISRAWKDVMSMMKRVESLPAMTKDEIKAEVQRLATEAYPVEDDRASKLMRDQYVIQATTMLSEMLLEYDKVIEEDARDGEDHAEDFDMLL